MLTTSVAGFLVAILDRPARRAGTSPTGWSATKHPSDRGSVMTGDASVRPTILSARSHRSFDRM